MSTRLTQMRRSTLIQLECEYNPTTMLWTHPDGRQYTQEHLNYLIRNRK